MTGLAADAEQVRWQTEVLRRASAILGGKLVGLWEVRADRSLVTVASNMPLTMAENAAPNVRDALRRIHMPSPPGSRWVGGQLVTSTGWCVAPVRTRAPDPPARLGERRSRWRLALELAGLCLGLHDKLAAGASAMAPRDGHPPLTDQLGALDPDVAAQLRAPRAAMSRVGSTVRECETLDPAFRHRVLKELGIAERSLEETALLLGLSQDGARGVLTRAGDFDLIPVVRSVVDAEHGGAVARRAAIEVEALGTVAPVAGDAEQLHRILSLLVHDAVLALGGRRGTVTLTLVDVGPVVRVTISVPGVMAESAIATARHIVETKFGGDLAVASHPDGPSTVVMLRLAVPQDDFRSVRRWRQG